MNGLIMPIVLSLNLFANDTFFNCHKRIGKNSHEKKRYAVLYTSQEGAVLMGFAQHNPDVELNLSIESEPEVFTTPRGIEYIRYMDQEANGEGIQSLVFRAESPTLVTYQLMSKNGELKELINLKCFKTDTEKGFPL
jgi:hypothetical protein